MAWDSVTTCSCDGCNRFNIKELQVRLETLEARVKTLELKDVRLKHG